MRRLVFALLVSGLFALPACHRSGHGHAKSSADVSFTPYSAVRSEPSTDNAVRFFEGDKQALSKAGAQYMGELSLDKKSKRSEARAADEAARVGATHLLQIENGRFALFRVDPERWNDLPRELRPGVMAGEPVSTTTITSYPVR